MRSLVFLLPVLFAGCSNYPSSLVPICTDAEAARDDRIVGEWKLTTSPKESQPGRFVGGPLDASITVTRQPPQYELVIRHKQIAIPFTCRLCKVGEHLIVDLQHAPLVNPALRGTTIRPHFLALCTIADDGSMRLTGCNPAVFQTKLNEGSLPSVVIDSKTVFAGTSEELRDLISEHCSELFPRTNGDVILCDHNRDGS